MGPTKINKIGKYEILDVLGKGGMGVVYKASDTAIGRLVAIKMITSNFADDAGFLKRFYREAQSTGKLQHPNIVIVHDLGDQDGSPFLVMEYLDGESLESIIRSRREIPLLDKLDYIIQACNGLQYAHQRVPSVIHRDIKPANLMVLPDNVVKIVDFGIAHVENENMTMQGQFLGSLQYMSPEQINCEPVDCRTDVFSTGIVLYQLLTYALPFQGKDTGSTLLKIINEPPPPLETFLQGYPRELDAIVRRALAKSREERYQTAEEFGSDLYQVQEQIKGKVVQEYIKSTQELIQRAELSQATEAAQQILKIDRQNTRGRELLREIQQLKAKQQSSEQARQIRVQAEQASADKQFGRALSYFEQAIVLDPANAELPSLRDLARQSYERQGKFREALKRAESAHDAGDLTNAWEAIAEAIAIDAVSQEAKDLRAELAREIEQRNRQAQLQGFLDEAQRQISSRHFTAALDALHKAEALDPVSSSVRELLTLAAAGREQELRRKQLEALTGEIEEALNHDDYQVACAKADEAILRFPTDRGLMKLKALAEKQRQAGEKRLFIESQISAARKLLEAGKTERALNTLQAALLRFPGEPSLVSLMTAVKENLEQERLEARKNDYLQRAKDALRRKSFEEAISILQSGSAELNAPEIEDLLQFAHEEATAHAHRQRVEAAAQEAQRLMSAEEHQKAIEFLKAKLAEDADEELRILLAEAQRQLDDFQHRVQEAVATADRLMRSSRFTEAVRFIETQPDQLQKSAQVQSVLESARKQQERALAIGAAVQRARAAAANQEFELAAREIENCRSRYEDSEELKKAAEEIESQRCEAAAATVRKAVTNARTLLLGRSYSTVLETLQGVADLLPLVPDDLRTNCQVMRDEAALGLERQKKAAELLAKTESLPRPPHDTADQTAWTVPPGTTSSDAPPNLIRKKDVSELRQLGHDSEVATDCIELEALSQRARIIAGRHPGDSEIHQVATRISETASARSATFAGHATLSSPSATNSEDSVTMAGMPATGNLTSATPAKPAPVPPSTAEAVMPAEPKVERAVPAGPEVVPADSVAAESTPVIESVETSTPALPQAAGGQPASAFDVTPAAVSPPAAPPPLRIDVPKTPEVYLPPPSAKAPQRKQIYVGAGIAAVIVLATLLAWRPWQQKPPAATANAIVVTTVPDGASVVVDNQSCVTPNCNLRVAPGEHQVQVALPGYVQEIRTVRVENRPVPITLSLKPLGNTVHVNTNFGNGDVLLDSKSRGTLQGGQLTLDDVDAGNHTIAISGPDGSAEIAFDTTAARLPAVKTPVRAANVSAFVLTNLGGNAHAYCNCSSPVKLAIDGHALGDLTAEGRDLKLEEGTHEVSLGQDEDLRTHIVKLGAAPGVNIFLNSQRQVGTLVVEAGVDNATVYINGRQFGHTSADGSLRVPLPARQVSVRVEKTGYRRAPVQFAWLEKNRETGLVFNLQPLLRTPSLSIAGGIADASVVIDGKAVGHVDANGRFTRELPAGEHTIELSKNGFKSSRWNHRFENAENFQIGGNLAAEASAPPPPGKPAEPPASMSQKTVEPPPFVSPGKPPERAGAAQPASPAAPSGSNADPMQQFRASADRGKSSNPYERADKVRQMQVATDRSAILGTIQRYASAYQHKNADEIQAVWPSLARGDRKKIAESFKEAAAVNMDLKPIGEPAVWGDSASVRCARSVQFTFRGGIQKPVTDTVTIKLLRRGGNWFIDSIPTRADKEGAKLRCEALTARAQLGEMLNEEERNYLKETCH